jgi:hypothetical protein
MASDIKVNNIKSYTGNTLNLGDTGDTINLTGTSFNGTSSVIWDTTAKTSAFNAVAGSGYFVNTTSAAITATLPSSPSAGDIVAFKDYAGTFGTNALTIARNGENIQGNANDSKISTNRASVILVYVDATKGWLYTNESNVADLQDIEYVAATGGTITTSGDFKIHTFTSSGTFTITNAGNPAGSTTVDYLVVAGGAGGATNQGGGGGAGGYRESFPNPATGGFPVTVTSYPITVGAGGAGGLGPGNDGTSGNPSIFSTITSTGGGAGRSIVNTTPTPGSGDGLSGGSGGGGASAYTIVTSGGTGNTPSVSPPQGNNGSGNAGPAGASPANVGAGGGGGAGAAAIDTSGGTGAAGGAGSASSISGSPVARGGGGGGSAGSDPASGAGGSGGGGAGGLGAATAGTVNTGGGGGGSGGQSGSPAASGGSGVVVIRYKFQ